MQFLKSIFVTLSICSITSTFAATVVASSHEKNDGCKVVVTDIKMMDKIGNPVPAVKIAMSSFDGDELSVEGHKLSVKTTQPLATMEVAGVSTTEFINGDYRFNEVSPTGVTKTKTNTFTLVHSIK